MFVLRFLFKFFGKYIGLVVAHTDYDDIEEKHFQFGIPPIES